ncbi:MAG: hypothetical protein HRT67_01155 [Flavobacteriaceae bacterium]|nr:hypothetical protein [Flavobacteriaceae bacterium]
MPFKSITLLFCFVQGYGIAQMSDFEHINFTKANNIAQLHQGQKLDNLPLLAYQLTYKLPTEVEKFRAIYFWVCQNIKGDNAQQNKVARAQETYKGNESGYLEWNTNYKSIAFKTLRKSNKTMCTGYAYLIRELCHLSNIECKIVNGYGRTVEANIGSLDVVNHSWNAVKLNNKWYLCDASWSSGYIDAYGTFISTYNDGYFLTEPAFFSKTHFPKDTTWLLTKTMSAEDFIQAPLLYGEAYKYDIQPKSPKKMNLIINKGDTIAFSFVSPNHFSGTISMVRFIGEKEKEYPINDLKYSNGSISFTYTFNHKGSFDTHIKVNTDLIASYTIKVRRKKAQQIHETEGL